MHLEQGIQNLSFHIAHADRSIAVETFDISRASE